MLAKGRYVALVENCYIAHLTPWTLKGPEKSTLSPPAQSKAYIHWTARRQRYEGGRLNH